MNNTVPVDFDALPDDVSTARDALLTPLPSPARDPRRHLRLAPTAAQRKRGLSPLIGSLVAVGIILVILAAQLGLSIAMSQGAYEARALELEQRDLARVERVLAQNADKLASPQNLAENATALGMVQNTQPASLRLSDGAILGSLKTVTTAANGNLIPNATLENMPVVDAGGLLISRQDALAGGKGVHTEPPVRWKGKLPAPNTH